MKIIPFLSAFFLIILFVACEHASHKKVSIVSRTDTTKASAEKVDSALLAKWEQRDSQDRIDSIWLDSIFQEALTIAYKRNDKDRFKQQYDLMLPDKSFKVSVDINSDFHFTKDFPHLIIRRTSKGLYDSSSAGFDHLSLVYIDILLKEDGQFRKVLSHKQGLLEYTNDTIRDINGDGLKDFTVNWYGTNGCCAKAFSNVYLSRPDMGSFSADLEFINPTFYPKEKVIRGLCYGHPGETEMYKYRWNGEGVDTVEYISYEKNSQGKKTGKVIVSNKQYDSEDNFRILKRLNVAPVEYRKNYAYSWFAGNPLP